MSTPITKKKHWIVEKAETWPLGNLYVDDLETRLMNMLVGALRGARDDRRDISHLHTLIDAHEQAERVVEARRDDAAATKQAA